MGRVGSLLIVTGPPGAGKSTVAGALAARIGARTVLVDGDAFFGFLASGAIEPWRPESHAQNTVVTEAAARATGRFAGDYDTVYDGVLGPWFLPTFVGATGLDAAHDAIDYVILLPSADACVARIRSRAGHAFSDERAARHMHEQFCSGSIERRHVLATDDLGVERTVGAVLSARAGGVLRLLSRSVSFQRMCPADDHPTASGEPT
jgi:predicted ABC-type ATPase